MRPGPRTLLNPRLGATIPFSSVDRENSVHLSYPKSRIDELRAKWFTLDGVARDQVLALPSLAARLCPSLILLQTRDWHQLLKVPAQIANVAVTMAKRFAGLQLAALLAAQGDPEGGLERVEEQTMLAKIKVRGGRVKRRDLYRGYAKQTSALHDPVIARLIAKELLSQEGSSWLVLTHQRVMQSS